MTWLAWRQHRFHVGAVLTLLGLVAVYMLATGIGMNARYHSSGLVNCMPGNPTTACKQLAYEFTREFPLPFQLAVFAAIGLLPLLAGVVVGAGLVASNTEIGVHRLAWMQSVSRTRWLTVKFALVSVPLLAGTVALQALLTWWMVPLAAAYGGLHPFSPLFFDLSGLVPVAYVICALAVGTATGTIVGRFRAGLGLAVLTFAALRAAIFVVRPHYMPPLSVSYPVGYDQQPAPVLNGYEVSEKIVDAAGRLVSDHHGYTFPNPVMAADCPNLPNLATPDQLSACASHAGLHFVAYYQPADRYWLFQGIESAIFLAVTVALLGLTVWWLQRRVS